MADATSQDQIHREGTDHIKETLANRQSGGVTEGTASTSVEPITPAQPPASNPGASNPSAGIPEGAGGLSSTAHIESPVPNHDEAPQGIVGTIKSYLGFSSDTPKEASEASDALAGTSSGQQGYVAAAGATVASAAVATGLVSQQTAQTALPDRTRVPASSETETSAVDFRNNFVHPHNSTSIKDTITEQPTGTESKYADTSAAVSGSTGAGSTFDSPAQGVTSDSVSGGERNTGAGSTFDSAQGATSDSTSGIDKNTGRGSTFDSPAEGLEQAREKVDENKEVKDDTSGEKKLKASADPRTMENRSAIPTAGGQKLGEKHWGESKIVPDNPKPQTDDKGVSSVDGQPTSEVADNTAKNTGGASAGPHGHGGSEEKHSVADKIKDKLPFGKK